GSSGQIERVQSLVQAHSAAVTFRRTRQNIHGAGGHVDCGCRGDADLRRNEAAGHVAIRDGRDSGAGVDEADLPKRRSGLAGSVEGIDAIVLSGDEEYVVDAFPGDLQVGDVERLRVNVSIHWDRE